MSTPSSRFCDDCGGLHERGLDALRCDHAYGRGTRWTRIHGIESGCPFCTGRWPEGVTPEPLPTPKRRHVPR